MLMNERNGIWAAMFNASDHQTKDTGMKTNLNGKGKRGWEKIHSSFNDVVFRSDFVNR